MTLRLSCCEFYCGCIQQTCCIVVSFHSSLCSSIQDLNDSISLTFSDAKCMFRLIHMSRKCYLHTQLCCKTNGNTETEDRKWISYEQRQVTTEISLTCADGMANSSYMRTVSLKSLPYVITAKVPPTSHL